MNMKTINRIRISAPPCLPACLWPWLRQWSWLLLLCFVASGCIYDNYPGEEEAPEPDGPVPVTIRLVTRFGPEGKRAVTRGLTETDEGQVDNVYVFFLRVSDDKVHSVVKGKDVTNTSVTEKTFTASLEVAGSAGQEFRCVVLANAGSLLDKQNLNWYKEKTYEQIQQKLVSDPAYTAAPVLAAGGFVMWGEADELVSATRRPQKVTVNMIRAVARVDIGVGINPGKWDGKDAAGTAIPFVLKKVFIFKPNDKCAFIPQAGTYDAMAKRVTKPTPAGDVCATPFEYDVQPAGTSPAALATSLTATIYLPEANVKQGENAQSGDLKHTDRCAIVVQGSYSGHTDTFYRIDFHNGNGTEIADLLRNHRYQASITSVSGDGETTAQEAYKSRRVNISATVLGWNDWSQDVVFDGTDHVYVKQKSILLPGNVGQTGTIGIESNVEPAEWQMSLDGGSFSTNETISNTDFEVTKPAQKAGGSLLIRTRNMLVNGQTKSATLRVKIHRLEFSISIEQHPDIPEDWVDGGEFPKDF